MEIIKYNDLDFSKMKKLTSQGSTSTVYETDNHCIKILDKMTPEEKNLIRLKLQEIDGLRIDNVLLPTKFIYNNHSFIGYFMDRFPNSTNLYDNFDQTDIIDFNAFLKALYKTSEIMRDIHNNGIILQDFSFDNILIDKNGNVKICDIDGCSYKGYQGAFMSIIITNYYGIIFRKIFDINQELDKQSLLFSMLVFIYGTYINKMKQYDELVDKSKTLQNIRPIFESLIKDLKTEIPYLDELIDLSDNFSFNRAEQIRRIRTS